MPNGYFVSDIQDYIQYIIKKDERLTTIPPIHVYINKINNIKWIYARINNVWNNELFGTMKRLLDKKKREKVPSLEVVEVVLIQSNSVDNLRYYILLHQINLLLIC